MLLSVRMWSRIYSTVSFSKHLALSLGVARVPRPCFSSEWQTWPLLASAADIALSQVSQVAKPLSRYGRRHAGVACALGSAPATAGSPAGTPAVSRWRGRR